MHRARAEAGVYEPACGVVRRFDVDDFDLAAAKA